MFIRDLPVTGQYVNDVRKNDTSVWMASGMDLNSFHTMRDSGTDHDTRAPL
jgi:hypothetical protein